jgi:glycosyltransferase involved in cell wall biosynthesis
MPDVVCFSHLRWDFVYQRPQHLLSRFAQYGRLVYCEEPVYSDGKKAVLEESKRGENITVLVPRLPHGTTEEEAIKLQKKLYSQYFIDHSLNNYLFWYYTPMAMPFTRHFTPVLTVYDCMDELSAFEFAHPELKNNEQALFKQADVVFTGGQSLYEAKFGQHEHVFPFPSSIDSAHFRKARTIEEDPLDQLRFAHPRFGFFGVIDERMDIELLRQVAEARPAWQIVMIGPVVKIDPATLPQLPNIHYLGAKTYDELPAYLSGWDVAILPFAVNKSTQFISPTKTPEYLAAGRPVVSTPIKDVIRPYGDMGLVHIASNVSEFVEAGEEALEQNTDMKWQQKTDKFLATQSWDLTWKNMVALMQQSRTGEL